MLITKVLLNGSTFNLSKFSKISAYVQQDDLLFGTLTVRCKQYAIQKPFYFKLV